MQMTVFAAGQRTMKRLNCIGLTAVAIAAFAVSGCSHSEASHVVVNAPPVQHASQSMPPQLQQVLNQSDRSRNNPNAPQGSVTP